MRTPFLHPASSFEELWSEVDFPPSTIPERFNLGVACVDDQDPDACALTVVAKDESSVSYTFGEVKEQVEPPGQRPAPASACGAGDVVGHRQPGLAGDGRRLHGHLPDGGRRPADVVAVRPRRPRLPAVATARRRPSSRRRPTRPRCARPWPGAAASTCIVIGGAGGGRARLRRTAGGVLARLRRRPTPAPRTRACSSTRRARPATRRARSTPTASCSATSPRSRRCTTSTPSPTTSSGRRPTGPGSPGSWTSSCPAWWYGVPVVVDLDTVFSPDRAVWLMREHKVTLTLLPATALRVIRASGLSGEGLSMRCVVSGGEAVGADLLELVAGASSAASSTRASARPS